MLELDFLSSKHALSLSDQPHLKPLLGALAAHRGRVTLVVGAGLSIDSGLPGWTELIERIARDLKPIEGYDVAELIKADTEDILRKAEHVISMRLALDGFGSNVDLVRKALFDGYARTLPGPIVLRLAALLPGLAGRVGIITTNFDDVLDVALATEGIPTRIYTLDERDAWDVDATSGEAGVPILHVHGRVERRDARGELVLTESEFLEHGPLVKQAIGDAVRKSLAVFVGLSITDPNVVGPLWEARSDAQHERYAVFVPGSRGSVVPTATERAYSILKSSYLEEKLGLRPIFLKSYTQLEQLLQEARIAAADFGSYTSTGDGSTAYGRRFDALLAAAYGRVGLTTDGTRVDLALERQVSDALAKELEPQNGIGAMLAELRSDPKVRKRLAELRRAWLAQADEERDEYFSIALWLRNPSMRGFVPYSIRMVATSSHTYNAAEHFPLQSVEIEPKSLHTAALSLMRGKGQLWDVPPDASFGMWRSSASSLLRVIESVSGETIQTAIGAVSLTSSHEHVSRAEDPGRKFSSVSLVSALNADQRRRLYYELELLGRRVVSEPATS